MTNTENTRPAPADNAAARAEVAATNAAAHEIVKFLADKGLTPAQAEAAAAEAADILSIANAIDG